MEEDLIPVLYNNCYGGFSISTKALKEYNKLNGNSNICEIDIDRHDPLLVKVFMEFGSGFYNKHSKIMIKYINKCFINHYNISEYDGLEEVHINIKQYKLDHIKELLLNESFNSDDKIDFIKLAIF